MSNNQATIKETIKSGFVFYLFSVAIVTAQFVAYLVGSPQAEYMDGLGNLFYLTASLSHAAIITLVPFIVFLIVALATRNKLAADITHIALIAILCVFIYINGRVYALYRFHINGLMIAMFFGEGGGDIFQINASIYLKMTAAILAIIVGCVALKIASNRLFAKTHKSMFVPALIVILSFTLFSNGTHAYAAVVQKQSVVKSAAYLPYYFPITATRFLTRIGVVSQSDLLNADFGERTGLNYPQSPIVRSDSAQKNNIILIAIDSWNYRGLTPETMPNSARFAANNRLYTNHLSSSNGTRGSIFGMFYGVSSYYWRDFDISGTTPVLVDELQNNGYQINTFASATLTNPNFAKLLFRKTNIKGDTEGERVYDRDCQLTCDFINWLDTIDTSRPFFAFLFYDLAHSFDFPSELQKKFTPSWDFADYMKLNNDMDPTPFWNLYQNCLNAIDSLIGIALNALDAKGLANDAYIILTGDHSQEFNENHKNYWGHNGNYSYPQIHVPLAIHSPNCQSDTITHRTTHYDISATLLHDVLGVTNPPSDYCMGRLLSDTTFRNWHVVGDNLNYAFIIDSNIIVEKRPNGMLDITDRQLNPLKNYKLKAADLNNAINKLNAFYAE